MTTLEFFTRSKQGLSQGSQTSWFSSNMGRADSLSTWQVTNKRVVGPCWQQGTCFFCPFSISGLILPGGCRTAALSQFGAGWSQLSTTQFKGLPGWWITGCTDRNRILSPGEQGSWPKPFCCPTGPVSNPALWINQQLILQEIKM